MPRFPGCAGSGNVLLFHGLAHLGITDFPKASGTTLKHCGLLQESLSFSGFLARRQLSDSIGTLIEPLNVPGLRPHEAWISQAR